MLKFMLVVCALAQQAVSNSDQTGDASIQSCIGEKGEKGDYGLPGIRGLRGHKGGLGAAGPKGDSGASGPAGPPGAQGSTGSVGPSGPKGSSGDKGQKGSMGPRGIEGADGDPGAAGHTGPVGPRGSKGEKGLKGVPGITGPRGPQGIPGEPIDQETLEKYFSPVKALQTEVSNMKLTLQSLASNDQPAAYLHGNNNQGTKSGGSIITDWYTGSGKWYSPILRGGMTYSNGYITVPKDGLYYIYGKIYFDPQSGQTSSGFRIYLNNQYVDFTYQYVRSPNSYQDYTRYSGLLKMVSKGDRIYMKFVYTVYAYMHPHHAQFGAFRVA
ncbi:collagen alpha-1(VIII) chain-like isoform X1 [Corticium candelabrum]|uniref:collagen alpha-1(VIII) chain-like isoform X1 n=1 Tax=Corticium candelabrum TaxID=121492 RepID=UPI002E2745A3|nr:collagen alpha-1(VIII) chain-like isoform X1 [Corticium candelabrum]